MGKLGIQKKLQKNLSKVYFKEELSFSKRLDNRNSKLYR